jgi:hypothetical protein
MHQRRRLAGAHGIIDMPGQPDRATEHQRLGELFTERRHLGKKQTSNHRAPNGFWGSEAPLVAVNREP